MEDIVEKCRKPVQIVLHPRARMCWTANTHRRMSTGCSLMQCKIDLVYFNASFSAVAETLARQARGLESQSQEVLKCGNTGEVYDGNWKNNCLEGKEFVGYTFWMLVYRDAPQPHSVLYVEHISRRNAVWNEILAEAIGVLIDLGSAILVYGRGHGHVSGWRLELLVWH